MEPTENPPQNQYIVDFNLQKQFNPAEFEELKKVFSSHDSEKSGNINKTVVTEILSTLGHRDHHEPVAQALISKASEHEEDSVKFETFVSWFSELKNSARFKEVFAVNKHLAVTKVGTTGATSYHSYNPEELSAFVQIINNSLANDPDLAYMMPINPQSDDLFDACSNGVLLCKLINAAVPDTIYEQTINKRQNLNIFQTKENLNLAINAAKSIGCKVISIVPESIMDRREHLILGLIWQIIKILMLAPINLKQHPELLKLVQEGEELSDLLKLPPEELLLRWFNYHLKNAGHPRKVSNFSGDVHDGECYTVLLNQIDPANCSLSPLQETDIHVRAQQVVDNARRIGVETVTTGQDVVSGNSKLNMLFTAAIFNNNPGLQATEQEIYEAVQLLDDDIEGTREERAFRMWINSLGIEDLYINNLYEEVKDGLTLLRILDKVQPGSVNWKRVEMRPNMRIKKVNNCNSVVEIGRNIGFKLVGIGGVDFTDGNRKLILAYVWQLVKHATLITLGQLTEETLLKWANSQVREHQITGFKDRSLASGIFLIHLYASIEPRAVNWELVTPGQTPEEQEQNAKYAISLARKLGASIFCVWEDITEVNPKMIITFVASAAHLSRIFVGVEESKEQI